MPVTDFGELGVTLADPAVLGDPDTLRKQVETERAPRPTRSEPGIPGQYDAPDASGAIWVAVDAQWRLVAVEISTSWRQRLAPEAFPDALYAAYRAAVRKAAAAAPAGDRYGIRLTEVPEVDADADFALWLAQSRESLRALEERLAEVTKANALARERLTDVRAVRGPSGYVTLELRGGTLIGVSGAVAGLKSANPNVLREDVVEAFRSAGLAAGQ